MIADITDFKYDYMEAGSENFLLFYYGNPLLSPVEKFQSSYSKIAKYGLQVLTLLFFI